MPTITLPLNPKAKQTLAATARPVDLNDVNNIAGWDADAQFAAARAKLKLDGTVSIHHRFVGSPDGIMHEYTSR